MSSNQERPQSFNHLDSNARTHLAEELHAMVRATKEYEEEWCKTVKILPSPRVPYTTPFRKEYQEICDHLDPHSIQPGAPWGFVVVRTVYGADSDKGWADMLEILRSTVQDSLSLANQSDLFPRYEMTVIEDEETLSGADSHTVRHTFRAWVANDITPRLLDVQKYGGREQACAKLFSNDPCDEHHPEISLPTRWNFCLFVDEVCLRSLNKPSRSETIKILISDYHEDSAGECEDDEDEGEDLGWMYMNPMEYVNMYDQLHDVYYWDDVYQMPIEGYIKDVELSD
jgi:hypothetical protein